MDILKKMASRGGKVFKQALITVGLTVAVAVGSMSAFAVASTAGLGSDLRVLVADQAGNIQASIGAIVGGVLTIVVGLVLADTILSQAATSGASANIGSFSGAQALNDLVPLIYYAVVVLIGVSLMGIGAIAIRRKVGA